MPLLVTPGRSLDYQFLRTLFAETEAILNSRPLTIETLGDVEQLLSPNNILTMKTKVVKPPVLAEMEEGVFINSPVPSEVEQELKIICDW